MHRLVKTPNGLRYICLPAPNQWNTLPTAVRRNLIKIAQGSDGKINSVTGLPQLPGQQLGNIFG